MDEFSKFKNEFNVVPSHLCVENRIEQELLKEIGITDGGENVSVDNFNEMKVVSGFDKNWMAFIDKIYIDNSFKKTDLTSAIKSFNKKYSLPASHLFLPRNIARDIMMFDCVGSAPILDRDIEIFGLKVIMDFQTLGIGIMKKIEFSL